MNVTALLNIRDWQLICPCNKIAVVLALQNTLHSDLFHSQCDDLLYLMSIVVHLETNKKYLVDFSFKLFWHQWVTKISVEQIRPWMKLFFAKIYGIPQYL